MALLSVALVFGFREFGALGGAADGPLPAAPTQVTAVAGSATSVHVMWNAPTQGHGITYVVYRDARAVREVAAPEHMVDVVRLTPGTRYTFTVRARDADGRLGPPGAATWARTPAAAAEDHTAPTRPGRLRGTGLGSRAVRLTWTAASDDRAVVSYDVEQGGIKIHSVSASATEAVLTGLRPGTAYTFAVRARDAAGNVSPPSTALRLTTPGGADGGATAPTAFRAASHRSGSAYYLDLSWVPPDVGGTITSYEIRLDGRTATSLEWGGTPPSGRARYSFYIGREAGRTHRVRLRARLPDGTWGGFSPELRVTTGAGSG
ncbi:fibronectin type III domain-containing protein [Streptomyces mangrovisoli]|uniref:fibronectin type III domain-containing protein n=1 Tax=Streptomyces mangrovisoli TaxID=1428628 RepID=UPI003B84554B